MLRVITKMGQMPFGPLKQIYLESNLKIARADYPGRSDGLLQAEMDFYEYLRCVFFRTDGAVYCLWEDKNVPVAALRLEPYRDGLLLTGLETDPDHRGKGYATFLVAAALEHCGKVNVYSHIHRRNLASVAVHVKCGFEKVNNFAVYLDGSVSNEVDTYLRKFV